jgi:hypothetical protein
VPRCRLEHREALQRQPGEALRYQSHLSHP